MERVYRTNRDFYAARCYLNGSETELTGLYKKFLEKTGENKVIDYLRLNLFSDLGIRRGTGPSEYLAGAARIMCLELGYYSFDRDLMKGGKIVKLSKILK